MRQCGSLGQPVSLRRQNPFRDFRDSSRCNQARHRCSTELSIPIAFPSPQASGNSKSATPFTASAAKLRPIFGQVTSLCPHFDIGAQIIYLMPPPKRWGLDKTHQLPQGSSSITINCACDAAIPMLILMPQRVSYRKHDDTAGSSFSQISLDLSSADAPHPGRPHMARHGPAPTASV